MRKGWKERSREKRGDINAVRKKTGRKRKPEEI